MDIWIQNVAPSSNHNELRVFLRDTLGKYDIVAFEVFKRPGNRWATVTCADANNAQRFLAYHGSRTPLHPLSFRNAQLFCVKSNKIGQPDTLKVQVLREKEEAIRARDRKQGTVTRRFNSSKPIFPFSSLSTGVWGYDHGKLIFDQKFRDRRTGTITFGGTAMVIYLRADTSPEDNWHCRIDIPYSTVEHTIPSIENGKRGTITLTLKSPPKIYKLLSTNDLHLYAGEEASIEDALLDALSIFNLKSNVKRMHRRCMLHIDHEKSTALCMVYRLVFPDVTSAQYAWNFVKDTAVVPQAQCWKTVVPFRQTTWKVEIEYEFLESILAQRSYDKASNLDFAICFQLLALVLEGTITPSTTIALIQQHIELEQFAKICGTETTANAIRRLGSQIPTPAPHVDATVFSTNYLIRTLQQNLKEAQELEDTAHDLGRKKTKHNHLALSYKATVTPTGLILRGPELGVSNRVLRKYSKHSEYFMRVFFADEDGMSVLHDPRADQQAVYDRFRKVLREGIVIAGRKYEFLGFSHSSLHYHTVWFMAPFLYESRMLYSKDVIEDLGDFDHIHCSAKCAARIGQAFSDTIYAMRLSSDVYVIENKDDVEWNGRCFSDGCGTISLPLLQKFWKMLPPDRALQKPTVLQIRYRGAKGVVSLDSSLQGYQLHLRKSMTKYNAREGWRDLEICGAAYRPLVMYLNHQFIKILEDLGVPLQNLFEVQNDALRQLQAIIDHPINAASFLEYSRSGTAALIPSLINLMHRVGLSFQADKFLTDMMEIAAMSSLRDMKYRARIPVEKGYLLYGIMDETNTLKDDEVYVVTRQQDEDGMWQRRILFGDRIVVTRAPALHPGDVQVVKAVDVPQNSPLRSLYNCIVFSQQGLRDLPSQLGGGDLDGDLFHVIFDERLIPRRTAAPADYPPTEAKDLGRPVKVDDIVDFFIEYMNSDRLGQISNKHKIRADVHDQGTFFEDCITLAKLASDAVDFSKSGKPVDMNQVPKGADHFRPDFMAKGPGLVLNELGAAEIEEMNEDDVDEPDSISILDPDRLRIRYYKSKRALGALFREIDERKFFARLKAKFDASRRALGNESLMKKLQKYIQRETRGFQWEHYRRFAEELREYYEENMLEIMNTLRPHRGKPLTELEVFAGSILGKKERASTRYLREANIEVQERFNRDVSAIIRRMRSGDEADDDEEEALPRAVACFEISLETEGWENYVKLRSWKYVCAGVCLEQLWKLRRSVNDDLKAL